MNIDECLKTCPSGVDMAEWIEQNWKPEFLDENGMKALEKLSEDIRKIRRIDSTHLHDWIQTGIFAYDCKCGASMISGKGKPCASTGRLHSKEFAISTPDGKLKCVECMEEISSI